MSESKPNRPPYSVIVDALFKAKTLLRPGLPPRDVELILTRELVNKWPDGFTWADANNFARNFS